MIKINDYNNTTFGIPNFRKEYQNKLLPLFDDKFAKFQLPYFSQFHYKTELDDELLKITQSTKNSNKRNALLFIGPSGIGKTSTCIRLLSNRPGIILTCTQDIEATSGIVTDLLMKKMFGYLIDLNEFNLYGHVEQVILLTIICRLIYIIKLINNAILDINIFKYFDNILPYLAFMQSNGYTNYSNEMFYYVIMKFINTPINSLNNFIELLINEILQLLNNNSKIFKIENELNNFIIIIDEANIYSSSSITHSSHLSNLINLNGEKLGLLSKIVELITKIDKFQTSIYCGTNLSINTIKSSIESKLFNIKTYYDFGLIPIDNLFNFLKLHINIPKKEIKQLRNYFLEQDYKYFRRRLITLAIEKLENNIDLLSAFKESINKCSKYIFNNFTINELVNFENINNNNENIQQIINSYQQDIKDALVNYIAHYKFSFLGSEFNINHEKVANNLLNSGFSGPYSYIESKFEISYYKFSAKDCLGFKLGKQLLYTILENSNKNTNEYSLIELTKYQSFHKLLCQLQHSTITIVHITKYMKVEYYVPTLCHVNYQC